MSKTKDCPSCTKEVAKSAKICPHCGKKLKMGMFLKIIIGIIVLAILGAVFGPSKEEKAQQLTSQLDAIASAQSENISSTGEISEIFTLGGDHTDIQRDNAKKEIIGKIVQWSLPVYEVKKRKDNIYRVQTKSGTRYVGAFITLHARNSEEITYIEGLKTGNMISFKGKITGTTMRNIDIEPAILVSK